jgi:uncharacterized membrane protein YgcG
MTAPSPLAQSASAGSTTQTLVTRLTVAFNRRRAYPLTHPLVQQAETQAHEILTSVLSTRPTVALGVGRDELLVDDTPVENGGASPRELAERLRQRGVGCVTFDRSTSLESLRSALSWLAPEAGEKPVRADELSIPGVTIAPIAYGRLALGDGDQDSATDVNSIWRALASVALLAELDEVGDNAKLVDLDSKYEGAGRGTGGSAAGADGGPTVKVRSKADDATGDRRTARGGGGTGGAGGDGAGDGGGEGSSTGAGGAEADDEGGHGGVAIDDVSLIDSSPADVAQAIDRRVGAEGYAKRVAFVLLRVADQVAQAPAAQRAELGERLRRVLTALKTGSLRAIIKSVGVGAQQRRFIASVIDALPVGAIVEWLERAATASGQELSHHLLRIVGKLSSRAYDQSATATRPAAESAFRGAAQELVRGWTLDDPNPVEHVALLDQISAFDQFHQSRPLEDTGAARLVQLALEVDIYGEDAEAATDELIATGHIGELLAWIATAPGTTAAQAMQERLVSPAAVRSILLRESIDQSAARALLSSLGEAATSVLLDVLRDSGNRTTRRLVYDRLREFGPAIIPMLTARFDGAEWYFVRNLLALLRDIGRGSGDQSDATVLFPYLDHTHEQVRLEALRLLVAEPLTRDAAVRRVLDDRSVRVIRVALEALSATDSPSSRSTLAPELVQRLVRFIEARVHDPELVARAVRALVGAAATGAMRDRLLGMVSRKTFVLRRLALVDPSPVVIAALEVLSLRYAKDAKVGAVIRLAMRASDRQLRDAVRANPHPPLAAAS